MPYRKLVSVCLALLLCFSCYPVTKPTYAFAYDLEGSCYAISHSVSCLDNCIYCSFQERGREEVLRPFGYEENRLFDTVNCFRPFDSLACLESYNCSSGQSPVIRLADFHLAKAYADDLEVSEDGRFGEAANADAQEQHEADSDGGEAVSQDAAAAEAQEVEASPFSQEVATADYGISLAAVSDSQFNYALYGMLSQFSGGVSFSVAGHTLWYKVGSVVYVCAALYQTINTYLPDIRSYTSDMASRLSTALTRLSNIYDNTNLLSVVFGNDNSVFNTRFVRLLVAAENTAKYSNNLSEVFFNSNSVFNTRFVRLLVASEGVNSNLSSFVSENAGWYVRQGRILGAIESFTSENAGWYTRLGRITGAVENLDSSISAFTSENASWYTRFARLLTASESSLLELRGLRSDLKTYLTANYDDLGTSITNWLLDLRTIVLSNNHNLYDVLKSVSDGFPSVVEAINNIDANSGGLTSNQLGALLGAIDGVKDAIMLNAAVDFVDAVVGDFSGVVDALQASTLESTMQSAFPFCIPAIVKQLLGLLQAEPMPPSFDFEIGGEVMHVDASQMQGFADIVSWACRFIFVIGLLFASRRFIFWEVAK